MTTGDVELVLQGARERYPDAQPRLITDNGSQSALGYVTPMDKLMGRADRIQRERRVKLNEAKERRIVVYS